MTATQRQGTVARIVSLIEAGFAMAISALKFAVTASGTTKKSVMMAITSLGMGAVAVPLIKITSA
jgi:uncharacterized protein (DUF2141 family)